MRETLTISLPSVLRRDLASAAHARHVTQSEFVRDAIRDKLWEKALDDSRRILIPRARSKKIYSDEDVFQIVS